jgi:hypothetical protein
MATTKGDQRWGCGAASIRTSWGEYTAGHAHMARSQPGTMPVENVLVPGAAKANALTERTMFRVVFGFRSKRPPSGIQRAGFWS